MVLVKQKEKRQTTNKTKLNKKVLKILSSHGLDLKPCGEPEAERDHAVADSGLILA